jgi:hypothetical protein
MQLSFAERRQQLDRQPFQAPVTFGSFTTAPRPRL